MPDGDVGEVPALQGAHEGRRAEAPAPVAELRHGARREVPECPQTPPDRLGRDTRRRCHPDGDHHVVARCERGHRSRQAGQPCHHGADHELLPGLLPDARYGPRTPCHRRVRTRGEGLRTRSLRAAHACRAGLYSGRAGQPVDGVYRHGPMPNICFCRA